MSAEEITTLDDKAASIWHVDRTARVSQLVSGDPKSPRALVLVRDNGRNSAFVEIEGTDHPENDPRVLEVEAACARGWEEGAGAEPLWAASASLMYSFRSAISPSFSRR